MSYRTLAALAFASSPAIAQPAAVEPIANAPRSEEAVRFRYEAPPECPPAAAFTARVRERTTRGREAAPEELARTFTLHIDPDARGFLGKIEFLDDAGAPVSRRVHGEECDAVVSSLALITALALDTTLRHDLADEASAPAPAPAPAASPAPVLLQPVPMATAAAAPPPSRGLGPPLLVSARIGAALAYESLLPGPVFGLLGQVDFRHDWSLRLVAHYERSTIEVGAGREISVRVIGLETSVCPLRPHVGDFSLYPCASLDIGSLHARGVQSAELPSVRNETRAWLALGPELRLAWEPTRPFWLELRGAGAVPLLTHSFELENPLQTALKVEGLTVSGGISGGLRFW